MTSAGPRAARVEADYSQYTVAAGPDIEVEPGEDTVPGLLRGLGPQAVAVITGLQAGAITVTAQALPGPPGPPEPGWDVVAETDLDCPGGDIAVCDWDGPGHDELGPLASAGPGRYRLRVHARHREQTSQRQSTEEHDLLIWPVAEPASARLLTPMDTHGRIFTGQEELDTPPLDAVESAAATAVRQLADLAGQPSPPALPGELTVVHAATIAPATPRRVWNLISEPWHWVGLGGGAGYTIYLSDKPDLQVRGRFVAEERPVHLTFTWSWFTTRWVAADTEETYAVRQDLITGEVTAVTRPSRALRADYSWMLPTEPTTVDVQLHRHGKGATAVELQHRDLPVELASMAQPFWQWAMQELCNRLTGVPFRGLPWDR